MPPRHPSPAAGHGIASPGKADAAGFDFNAGDFMRKIDARAHGPIVRIIAAVERLPARDQEIAAEMVSDFVRRCRRIYFGAPDDAHEVLFPPRPPRRQRPV